MVDIILDAITNILNENKELLRIPLRQKAKFEGWLKFELAYYLERMGMEKVEVEAAVEFTGERTDIVFNYNGDTYRIELKTPNTNYRIDGVRVTTRPITKNIKSIVNDVNKLNSTNGIVAFVLFPVPVDDNHWEVHIDRIARETEVVIDTEKNCRAVKLSIDEKNKCNLIVCVFSSKA